MKYLFSMTVGPVQSFIVAARKTRDLYAGSWVLSEVAKAAARPLSQGLIFPAATDAQLSDRAFTAVNKILSIAETSDPVDFVAQARGRATDRLLELATELALATPSSLVFDSDKLVSHLTECLDSFAFLFLGRYDGQGTRACWWHSAPCPLSSAPGNRDEIIPSFPQAHLLAAQE